MMDVDGRGRVSQSVISDLRHLLAASNFAVVERNLQRGVQQAGGVLPRRSPNEIENLIKRNIRFNGFTRMSLVSHVAHHWSGWRVLSA